MIDHDPARPAALEAAAGRPASLELDVFDQARVLLGRRAAASGPAASEPTAGELRRCLEGVLARADLVEAERATLLQQQAALKTVIASVPHFVFWKDVDCVYRGCNDIFAGLGGLKSPEEIVGRTDYDMPWTKAQSDLYREDDLRVMQTGTPKLDIEETNLDARGNSKVLLTSKVPLRARDGAVIGMLGIFADITSRKQLEQDLGRAKDAAEAANRAKSDFLSSVGHELRTPLALILGPLDSVLERADVTPGVRAELERVLRNANRLKNLMDDVLDFAKADAGMVVLREEVLDLEDLVRSIVDDIRPAAVARGLELQVSSAATGLVRVDRRMCEKILLNLIGNALKFTPAGGTIVATLRVEDDAFELAVRDTGIGIAAPNLPLLFDRFYQVDASSTRRYEGTGLGLALVKQFSQLMGGTVGVESELEKGSRFFVRLPRRAGDLGGDRAPRPARSHADLAILNARFAKDAPDGASAPAALDASRDRPLIVLAEDNDDLRAYLCQLLEQDHRVVACANGAAALAAATSCDPDVILTDVMMPEMDGFELLARLKADPALRSIPVVMLTAQASHESLPASLAGGAHDFLNKPFRPSELLARVGVATRLSAAHRALCQTNIELVSTRATLIEAEKFAALGRVLAQLSHEINNPMGVIMGNLITLKEYLPALIQMLAAYASESPPSEGLTRLREELEIDTVVQDFGDALDDIHEAVRRVGDIQDDLRIFLRGAVSERNEVDLNDAVSSTTNLVRRGLPAEVELTSELGALPEVAHNAGQLKQVLLNLIRNAADAAGPGGTIHVASRAEGGEVLITITDSGPGVPVELRGKIFEPFFTTKDVGTGTGLGLSISRQLIESHGGSLALDEDHHGGARFVVRLPCIPAKICAASEAA